MLQIINYLRLSRTDSDEISVIEAKQGDNQGDICQIEIYDNQDIVDLSQFDDILFTANKPDRSSVLFRLSDDKKNLIKNGNILSLTLTDVLLSVHGTVECELSFYKGDIIKSTYNFNIYVFKSPGSFDVMNESDISTVKGSIKEVVKIEQNINESVNKAKQSEENAKISETNVKASEESAKNSASIANTKATEAKNSATAAKTSETNAKTSEVASAKSESNALNYSNQASASKDAAKTSETNAKTSEQNSATSAAAAKKYADSWKGSLLPKGDVSFAQLPTSGMIKGYMYRITNHFVTDSRFEEGIGYFYPADTCVYWTANNQWKCLSGVLSRELTQAEYDTLSTEEKNNGTIYYISDGDNLMKVASSSLNGLMSANDKKKLDSIETGANKTTIDSALSSTSTNPVQNKVVNTALNGKASSSHKHTKSEITDFPTSMAANGGNSTTVNGYTVNSDVPANAKFTDTTYSDATTSTHGLMSVADKKKLDGITSGANTKFISLTQSQYNALSTIENNVIYFITDAN